MALIPDKDSERLASHADLLRASSRVPSHERLVNGVASYGSPERMKIRYNCFIQTLIDWMHTSHNKHIYYYLFFTVFIGDVISDNFTDLTNVDVEQDQSELI